MHRLEDWVNHLRKTLCLSHCSVCKVMINFSLSGGWVRVVKILGKTCIIFGFPLPQGENCFLLSFTVCLIFLRFCICSYIKIFWHLLAVYHPKETAYEGGSAVTHYVFSPMLLTQSGTKII